MGWDGLVMDADALDTRPIGGGVVVCGGKSELRVGVGSGFAAQQMVGIRSSGQLKTHYCCR